MLKSSNSNRPALYILVLSVLRDSQNNRSTTIVPVVWIVPLCIAYSPDRLLLAVSQNRYRQYGILDLVRYTTTAVSILATSQYSQILLDLCTGIPVVVVPVQLYSSRSSQIQLYGTGTSTVPQGSLARLLAQLTLDQLPVPGIDLDLARSTVLPVPVDLYQYRSDTGIYYIQLQYRVQGPLGLPVVLVPVFEYLSTSLHLYTVVFELITQ